MSTNLFVCFNAHSDSCDASMCETRFKTRLFTLLIVSVYIQTQCPHMYMPIFSRVYMYTQTYKYTSSSCKNDHFGAFLYAYIDIQTRAQISHIKYATFSMRVENIRHTRAYIHTRSHLLAKRTGATATSMTTLIHSILRADMVRKFQTFMLSHTYIHTYIHTNKDRYIHTYTDTYIHT
jgi:hypothetical protein